MDMCSVVQNDPALTFRVGWMVPDGEEVGAKYLVLHNRVRLTTESEIRLSQRQNCLCVCSPDIYLQIKILACKDSFRHLFVIVFFHQEIQGSEGQEDNLKDSPQQFT